MPIREGVMVNSVDLIADSRFDLVLALSRIDSDPNVVTEVLDDYRADWREALVDDGFESYVAPDGVVSIRASVR